MDLQRLRCKVNFEALVFVPHIRALGDTLVNRLRQSPDKHQDSRAEFIEERIGHTEEAGTGKFVVLHLRFDKVITFLPPSFA